MNYGKRAVKRRKAELDAVGVKVRKKIGVILGKTVLVCLLLVGIIGMSAGIGVWKGIIDSAPDISAIDVVPTGYSTAILDRNGKQTATLVASGANRKYVTIDEVPLNLQHAFVAIEDARFYTHNGIDPKGILRAFAKDIVARSTDQGASTITQQLIKNSVLENTWSSESSVIEKVQRKVQEQYLAVELEKQVSKSWILEEYMNTINLGANTLGIQAASERYFGKDVSELTLSECAVIAGITKNPVAYNPIRYPEKNKDRRQQVLLAMLDQGYITQEQYDDAIADDVYSRISMHNEVQEQEKTVNSYFDDAVINNVLEDLVNDLGWTETEAYKAIYQGGLTIWSTQDPDIQTICDEEVNDLSHYPSNVQYSFSLAFQVKKADGTCKNYSNQTMLSYYKATTGNENYDINYSSEDACVEAIHQYEQDVLEEGDEFVEGSESYSITLQPEVALTIIDQYTGEVKALVGGRGEKNGNRTWNRATDTLRQPGSTFKIIGAYAPALDAADMTLGTVQYDSSYTVGSKTFKNYDNSYRGFTNIRTAITNSINIVTVKTLEHVGVNVGYEYATNFGFTTLCEADKNLGLCLGGLTNGVSNLELTAAYATIANGGEYLEPKFYSIVYDHDGNVLLDRTKNQKSHRVIKETTAWLLTDAMKDVMTSGTGTRAYFGSSMAQAGKSGTTTSNRDALFAGYTPYYSCVVWGGFDDNSIQNSGETSYPKDIWKAVMSRIHENLEYKDFEKPEGIVSTKICAESGLLPIANVCDKDQRGSKIYTEYFDIDTKPTQKCNNHVTVKICKESNKVANEYCPKDQVVEKTYIRDNSASMSPTSDMAGTSSGSTREDSYVATNKFLKDECDVHTKKSQEKVEQDDSEGTQIDKPQSNYIEDTGDEGISQKVDKTKKPSKDKDTDKKNSETTNKTTNKTTDKTSDIDTDDATKVDTNAAVENTNEEGANQGSTTEGKVENTDDNPEAQDQQE